MTALPQRTSFGYAQGRLGYTKGTTEECDRCLG